LRLILVSGKTKEYLFSPSESAGDISQFVFDNWPTEWEEEAVRQKKKQQQNHFTIPCIKMRQFNFDSGQNHSAKKGKMAWVPKFQLESNRDKDLI